MLPTTLLPVTPSNVPGERIKSLEDSWKPILISAEPWNDVAIDFLMDLPMAEGLMTLLVFIDCFSKMMHIVLVKQGTTA